MDTPLDTFLTSARSISLEPAEKEQSRNNVRLFVRDGGDTRLGSHMHENILSAAKIVGLSASEKTDLKGKLFQTMEAGDPLATTLGHLSGSAKHIRLSPAEHAGLKEGLFAAIEERQTFFYRINPFRIMAGVMASILLITLAGTGVAYAAEEALPGESLYFVKLNVNEALWSRLADDTSEKRARFAISLAERRLTEALELAAREKLAADKREIIEMAFAEKVEAALADVDTLFRAGDLEAAGKVALELGAAMQAHANVLASQQDSAPEITPLLTRVYEAGRKAEKITIIANLGSRDFLMIASDAAAEAIQKAEREIERQSASDRRSLEALIKISNAKKDMENEQALSESERLRSTRSALRKAKEATLMLHMKVMRPRISPSSNTIADPADDPSDAADIRFTTSVQLEMADEELDALEKKFLEQKSERQDPEEEDENEDDPLAERLENGRTLIQEAAAEADIGNVGAALEKSEQALREAESAKIELRDPSLEL